MGKIKVAHYQRLEAETHKYFSTLYPGCSISFRHKKGGIQLGLRVDITIEEGGGTQKRTYFVKTHSHGRAFSSMSADPRIIDPTELMVYKILEHLGIGSETHFFQRSLVDVYIATLDAGHSGEFKEFSVAVGSHDCLIRRCDEEYGITLWGSSLQSIPTDPCSSSIDIQAIEASIKCDEIAGNFILQIASLDMLSRIMQLHDLLNSTSNFGFFTSVTTAMPQLKIIDFRLADTFITKYSCSSYFQGFLDGIDMFHYNDCHRVLRYSLYDRPQEEIIKSALHVLTHGSLGNLLSCIDLAYEDMKMYLNSNELFADQRSERLKSLDEYCDALRHNYLYFLEQLGSWEKQ